MDYHCNLSCIYICFCWWSLMYQRLDSCPTSWWSYTNGSWEMANMSYRGFLYISQWLGLLISQKSKVFCTYDRSLQHFPTNSSNLIDLSCFFLSEPLQSVILKLQRAFFSQLPVVWACSSCYWSNWGHRLWFLPIIWWSEKCYKGHQKMSQESQDLEAQNRMIGSQLRRKRAEVSESTKKCGLTMQTLRRSHLHDRFAFRAEVGRNWTLSWRF